MAESIVRARYSARSTHAAFRKRDPHGPALPDDLTPVFDRAEETGHRDRTRFPDGEMLPATAYQLIHDETMLDGNSRLNLATFVGTWMDEEADKLYAESYDKNMIDKDEYPKTAQIEERTWRMLADLWNAPDPHAAIGTSTIGSSEACMLGGLALKRTWQLARRAAGKSTERPNLVMSSGVQVCWEKFCNYWDVEMRIVPITEEHPCLDGHDLHRYVDEHTIGVVAIMGVTYTGAYEPVEAIAAALDRTRLGFSVDFPAARRACCQRRLSASPPSMAASEDPMVDVPIVLAGSGAFHRSPRIFQHRVSIAAVAGYSSLSIMFLSAASS